MSSASIASIVAGSSATPFLPTPRPLIGVAQALPPARRPALPLRLRVWLNGVPPWMAALMAVVILALPAHDLVLAFTGSPTDAGFGGDFNVYRDAASRWLSSGAFYQPWQLTGHYQIWAGGSPVLYPPVLLYFLIPFQWLPAALWWAIPLGVTGWSIVRLRPAPWSWPLLALCVAWPPTLDFIAHGNPDMWALAFLSVGCVYAGPAVFVLLKPTMWPFALMRFRLRWFVVFVVLSAPFVFLWVDWVRVVLNSDGSLAYGLQEWPMMALPLVAWMGRKQ